MSETPGGSGTAILPAGRTRQIVELIRINACRVQGVYAAVMRIDTERALQLFGSGWVGVAILIATLAIGAYVILKPASPLDILPLVASNSSVQPTNLQPQNLQPQNLPQTQMAAAAVVIGTIVFPGALVRASRIVTVEKKTARLRGNLPGTGSDDADASDVDVVKLDDCRFEAVQSASSTKLATVDLGVLSSEYRSSQDGRGRYDIAVIGNGARPAVCFSSFGKGCYKDLHLGFAGQVGAANLESATRPLRAVQFLQKYCPPQQLGF